MKLSFLGTKGYIEESSSRHKYHSSLLIEHNKFRLLIDHGIVSRKLNMIRPNAILITHAHPDAFMWLLKDEKYDGKIYVTNETKKLSKFDKNFEIIKPNKWFYVGPFKVMAYKVIHSLIAPAVGFKISIVKTKNKTKTLVYNPDLIVPENKSVLNGVDLYIGDGSSFMANLVRKKGNKLFGHARMSTQINWCMDYEIKNAIFTHLGKEPLRIGDKNLVNKLKHNKINGMNISIAYDGMESEL